MSRVAHWFRSFLWVSFANITEPGSSLAPHLTPPQSVRAVNLNKSFRIPDVPGAKPP